MSLSGTPSSELEEANDLIVRGCKEIQKMFEPKDGRVPKPNIQAALHLLSEVLKAYGAADQADYARCIKLLDWAHPGVPA